MSIIQELKKSLESEDLDKSSKHLEEIINRYRDRWLTAIMRAEVLPNPTSQEFSSKSLVTFLKSLEKLYGNFCDEYIREALAFFRSLLLLYSKIQRINELQSGSAFYKYHPSKQIHMFCVFLEDQARLTIKKFSEKEEQNGTPSPVDIVSFNLEDKGHARPVSALVNFEGMGDAVSLNLRHIFNKYAQALDGTHYRDVFPYGLEPVYKLLILANIRLTVGDIWQKIKFRDWKSSLRNRSTFYFPPDKKSYLKEEASISRYRLYFNELATGFLASFRPNEDRYDEIIKRLHIKVKNNVWQINIPARILKHLLSLPIVFDAIATELHFAFYKGKLADILIGPRDKKINGEDVLLTCKYIYILSSVYQMRNRAKFDEDNESQYYTLVPVVKERNLVNLLMEATGWSKEKSESSLSLFYFNPQHKKIDIWFQPLIPIGGGNLFLVPCVAKSIDVVRLFQSHFLQWGIKFDDRGPLFESSIREELKKNLIGVASNPIKFIASDGKTVEFDVLSWFEGSLFLIEAKCLRIPHSPVEFFSSWNEILNGVEQLKRRRRLIKSDWGRVKELAGFALPEQAPEDDNILCILITNIFSFTGFEIDGIRITDFTCFCRYFAEPEIKRITVDNSGIRSEEIVERIREGEEPAAKELWDFIQNPPVLRDLLKRIKMRFYQIPPVDKQDTNIFCGAYTIIEK